MPMPCARESPGLCELCPLCRDLCILEMSDPPKQQHHSHSEPSGTALSCVCSQGSTLGSSISCLLSISPPCTPAWTCPPSNKAMWLESGGLLV